MATLTVEKIFMAGLGGALLAKGQFDQTIQQLVNKGEEMRENRNVFDDLQSRADSEKNRLEERGKAELRRFFADNNIAFTSDISRLEARIAELEAKLEALTQTPAETAE